MSIHDVVDPGYWQQHSREPGSKTPRILYDHLCDASYKMITTFVKHLTKRPKTHWNISAERCIRLLAEPSISGTAIPAWPLPSPKMPSDNDNRWGIRPEVFPAAQLSLPVVDLVERVQARPPTKISFQQSPSTNISITGVVSDDEHNENDELLYEVPEPTHTNRFHDAAKYTISICSDEHEIDSENEILSGEESQVDFFQDNEGNTWTKPHIDLTEDSGPSIDLKIPGVEVLVTQAMIDKAASLCDAEKKADIEAIAKVVEAKHAWGEFTKTTVLIGSLSVIGQAALVQDSLDALYAKIDGHKLY